MPKSTTAYALSEAAAQQLEALLKAGKDPASQARQGSGGASGRAWRPNQQILDVVLDDHLEASTSDGSTEATAAALIYRGSGDDWADSDDEITVTNRSDGLWLPSGSVIQVVRVNDEWRPLAAFSSVVGKTDSSHNKSASGTVSVWAGTSGSGLSDTTLDITAYNRYANISSGKWVTCQGYYWGWEIISAEC